VKVIPELVVRNAVDVYVFISGEGTRNFFSNYLMEKGKGEILKG